jgi:hypothetical protein
VRLGRVSQVSPLRVLLNGDTGDAPAEALSDFTGATTDTEVLVTTIEGRRFALRVR